MQRRRFFKLTSGAAAAWPLSVLGKEPEPLAGLTQGFAMMARPTVGQIE